MQNKPKVELTGYYYFYILFLSILILGGNQVALWAVPACPNPFTIEQPDGRKFQARAKGDEWLNWTETNEGHPVMRNKKTGFWEYAKIEPATGLTFTGKVVAKDMPIGIKKILGKNLKPFMPKRGFGAPGEDTPPPGSPPAPPQPAPLNILGTRKLLVIAVNFVDRNLTTTEANWASHAFGATNSIKEYYTEVSYNQLTIAPAEETYGTADNGIVIVTLDSNHPNTGSSTGTPNQQLAKDAIIAANPFVNFASFDTDSNGQITTNELHIMIIPAGYERAYSLHTPNVWGHKWVIQSIPAPVVDGKTVGAYPGGYTQFGELHFDHQATIGIMIHELGHDYGTATEYLGFPDLYDYTDNSRGIGKWDVMAGGSWNATTYYGDTPAHPGAWCKYYAGWVTPIQITVSTPGVSFPQVEIAAGADHGIKQVLNNPNGPEIGGTGEYFLLENRQQTGYDSQLPGAGLLIWHIDETRTDNNNEARKLVDLEAADGLNHMDNNVNSGDTGDPYPGSTTNQIFDNISNPNSKLYSSAASGVIVSNISDSAATMTADINKSDSPPILTSPGDKNIEETQVLTFTLSAYDPDEDIITYSMVSAPAGATLDSSTGVFDWTPAYNQANSYHIIFTATAHDLSDSKAITITVSSIIPLTPSGLTATTVSVSVINLTWTRNSPNEDGFKIECSWDNITFTPIATVGTNVTFYSDTDLSSDTTYDYRVRAYNSTGDSEYSDIVSATTLTSTIGSGSSGHGKHKAWYKVQTWKCGLIGLEPLLLIFIIRLLRRKKLSKIGDVS